MPHAAAWPFILASVCIHFTYYQLVGAAYRHGDIGLVYPLMRGVAPLIVATTSGTILGEHLSPVMFAGVMFICVGVLTMALDFRHGHGKAIWVALANAVVISGYTYVDGIGARLAGNPISYTIWICILPPIPLFSFAFFMRGVLPVLLHVRLTWRRGLFGGAGSMASYGLALFAMTKAPIAAIAALRETSIFFALIISIFILKEKASPWRYVAGALIAAGALTMKLG
jgi:drug/metabolite transporter (DMT)-like permease